MIKNIVTLAVFAMLFFGIAYAAVESAQPAGAYAKSAPAVSPTTAFTKSAPATATNADKTATPTAVTSTPAAKSSISSVSNDVAPTATATTVKTTSTVTTKTDRNVTPQTTYTMKLVPSSLAINAGQTAQFSAEVQGSDGTSFSVNPSAIGWSVTGGIGTIGQGGLFTATTPGSGIVTGTFNFAQGQIGLVASAPVTVTGPTNQSAWLEIIPGSATLAVGQTQQFDAVFHTSSGSAIDVPVTWSAIGGIGTIAQNGLFIATSAGNGLVKAVYQPAIQQNGSPLSYDAYAQVTVISNGGNNTNNTNNSAWLEVIPHSAVLLVGQTEQFDAILHLSNGGSVDTPVSWSTTGGIGSIDSNGLFTATSAGSGVVIATYNGINITLVGTASVAVLTSGGNGTNNSEWLEILPSSAALIVGQTQQFDAYFHTSSGTMINVQANWSASPSIGTITQAGLFTANAAGNGEVRAIYQPMIQQNGSQILYIAIAPVSVTDPGPANNTTVSFAVSPQFSTLAPGQSQQFTAILTINGTPQNVNANWSMIGTPGVGTLGLGGLFTAASQGSAIVVANYQYGQPAINYQGMAFVNVTSGTVNNTTWIEIVPASATLTVGQAQQFSALLHVGQTITLIPASSINWSTDNASVGTIDAAGLFSAASAGSAVVTAVYTESGSLAQYSATAPVTVNAGSSPPSGGNGNGGSSGSGSNNGGAAYKTSTTTTFTCAGKIATVKITYLINSASSATVEIYYLGATNEKVYSKTVSGTDSFEFTPQHEGRYEVRVSLSKDQASQYFTVPPCSADNAKEPKNVTVSLLPKSELILSKTVRYGNGFVKKFEVYRTTEGTNEKYNSQITLTYESSFAVNNSTVLDTVPKNVLASVSQIAFEGRPSRTTSGSALEFEWDVKKLGNGDRLEYKYSFSRALSEAMIDSFASPKLIYAQTKATDQGSLLSAALFGLGGFDLVLVVLVILVAASFVYLVVFSKKEKEE